MKSVLRIIIGLLIASFLVSGCSLLGTKNSTNETALQTSVANTIVALQTSMALNTTPTPEAPATSTPEVLPTFTALASVQPTAAYVAPTETPQPGYLVTNVEDITVPDNTVLKPGESFTKTWRLTNGGAGTWTPDFKLVFVSGDQMGAASVTLGRSVAPNNTIDVSVNLVAPSTVGTYQGNFMLQTNGGKNFGVGPNGTSAFWVKIGVQQFFQVTSAVVNADPTTFTGTCPGTVNLTATITSSAAGSVNYYFVTSTGNTTTYTMTFTAGGSQTSSAITWPVTGPDALTVKIYIDNPNHQAFPQITIPVTCS